MLGAVLLQIVCALGVASTSGLGLTVIATSNVAPLQPAPLLGVTLYVTICAVLVGLTNVCAMLAPLPDVAPVTDPGLLWMIHV